MGKAEVIEFLEKNKGKWFTARQVEENLETGNANTNLGSLWKSEVEIKMNNLERRDSKIDFHFGYEWRIK